MDVVNLSLSLSPQEISDTVMVNTLCIAASASSGYGYANRNDLLRRNHKVLQNSEATQAAH